MPCSEVILKWIKGRLQEFTFITSLGCVLLEGASTTLCASARPAARRTTGSSRIGFLPWSVISAKDRSKTRAQKVPSSTRCPATTAGKNRLLSGPIILLSSVLCIGALPQGLGQDTSCRQLGPHNRPWELVFTINSLGIIKFLEQKFT